jgi:hypothetical protein
MLEEQKVPTKDELITFLNEQIEVKEVQLKLQNLNTALAKGRAEELQALNFIGNMTNPSSDVPRGTPHKLTEEDLANNPDLVEAGLKVGDEVLKSEELVEEKQTKSRGLKK